MRQDFSGTISDTPKHLRVFLEEVVNRAVFLRRGEKRVLLQPIPPIPPSPPCPPCDVPFSSPTSLGIDIEVRGVAKCPKASRRVRYDLGGLSLPRNTQRSCRYTHYSFVSLRKECLASLFRKI
jgi:hypothetical protein